MYEDVTPETIEAAILEKITEFDTREGSFARSLVAPAAYELTARRKSMIFANALKSSSCCDIH